MDEMFMRSQSAIRTPLPPDPALAMAYVPFQQQIREVYTPQEAFDNGTLFPELNKPFYGERGFSK